MLIPLPLGFFCARQKGQKINSRLVSEIREDEGETIPAGLLIFNKLLLLLRLFKSVY